MTEREFRLLVVDRYEEAVNGGKETAQELLEWLKREAPLPSAWWMPHIYVGLSQVAWGGTEALLASEEPEMFVTPAQFRDFSAFKARYRHVAEQVSRDLFNPYRRDDPRRVEHQARFERMVDAALAFAGESERLDDQIAPLVASALSRALRADPDYRVYDGRVGAIRGLVSRLTCPRCLPVPEHVQLAASTLRRVLEYWDRQDAGVEEDD